MLFNSLHFLIFFPVVANAFFVLPDRWRGMLLLIASYYFYMCWRPPYIVVIIFITMLDYFAGIMIERATDPRAKQFFLGLSLCGNLGLLLVFKYFNFLAGSLNQGLQSFDVAHHVPLLKVVLPIGLSFHTFQAISYTIEVYRGRVPAERNLLDYALYVSFFPQMVAGPIERPYHLLPQFKTRKRVEFAAVRSGLELALWGFFKKVVIADRLAAMVGSVYAAPHKFNGGVLTLATVLFTIQIYCDFSGYSDIAIGCARVMGFELMTNFRQPYFAQSIEEYWRRWHISLSTWFRDYLYIPLGGNRVSTRQWCTNIMIVFTLSGMWHGANWTYLIWGAMHGVYYLVGRATAPLRSALSRMLGEAYLPRVFEAWRMLFTFALISFAFIMFRAQSFADAMYIYSHFFHFADFHWRNLGQYQVGLEATDLVTSAVMIAIVLIVDWIQMTGNDIARRTWDIKPVRWVLYYACAYAIVFFGVFEHVEFIYFRF